MLAIAGCSEDNTHPKVSPVDEPSADAVTILATIDAIPSATGDGEAYAPLWQEGDQIVVGYKGISYVYETYDAGNGVEFHPMALSLPADARGEVTAYFKAVDGVFAVGADQTGATLPMYAYAADAAPAQGSLGLHFKPLASVLSLTIGEEASKTISKITLEPVDPDGVEGHLAVSEAVVDPRTGAVTVGEDAAVSDILTMEIGEMSLVQAQTVNFLIASGTKVDGGLKATISCTDGSVFVKNLFEGQEVAFAGNCVGAATELFFRLRIATYEDMVNFAQECADDNGGAIVDLQADIDMRNVPWTPIENFTGTFNGNGHRIYNINVSADGRYAGFFAYAKGAISDVVFGSKDGTSYDGTSRIELKYSADTDTWCYAGIVAQSNNTLTGVTSFVPVTVTADSRCKSRTGGIVGSLYNGKMSGCRNYGAVSNVATAGVASYVAGIAGIVDGSGDAAGAITLDGCHNHGPVMTSLGLGNAVAGITASVMKTAVNTTISNCTNAGEIRFDNAGASAAHRLVGIVARNLAVAVGQAVFHHRGRDAVPGEPLGLLMSVADRERRIAAPGEKHERLSRGIVPGLVNPHFGRLRVFPLSGLGFDLVARKPVRGGCRRVVPQDNVVILRTNRRRQHEGEEQEHCFLHNSSFRRWDKDKNYLSVRIRCFNGAMAGGPTLNSPRPSATRRCVARGSAASSPHIPASIPARCAASSTMPMLRCTAGSNASQR